MYFQTLKRLTRDVLNEQPSLRFFLINARSFYVFGLIYY